MTSESSRKITRRRLLATTAASTALIAMPYVRSAHAAGKLSVGLWDHWVPGANDVSRKIIQEWGEKEKVDVQIDYITSQGEKLRLTMAAEAQAKSGHDLLNAGNVWDTAGLCRAARAHERHYGAADQAERRRQSDCRISRPFRRQVARGSGHDRQPDQGPVLAHRPLEAACRHRHPGHVSSRRPTKGR